MKNALWPLVLVLAAGGPAGGSGTDDESFGPGPESPYGRRNPEAPTELALFEPLLGEYRLSGQRGRTGAGTPGWIRLTYVLDGWGVEFEQRTESSLEVWVLVFDPAARTWWIERFRAPDVVARIEQGHVEQASEGGAGISVWSGSPDLLDGRRRRLVLDGEGALVQTWDEVRGGEITAFWCETFSPKPPGERSPWAAADREPTVQAPSGRPYPDATAELGKLAFLVGDFSFEAIAFQDGREALASTGTRSGRLDPDGWCIRLRGSSALKSDPTRSRSTFNGLVVFDPARETFRYTVIQMPGATWSRWDGLLDGDDLVLELAESNHLKGLNLRVRLTRITEAGFEARVEAPDMSITTRERHTRIR